MSKTKSSSVKKINKEKAFVNEKAKTIISNVGFYLMLLLDGLFLVVLLMSGFEFPLLLLTIWVLILEVLAVLFMLPIPLLQVGIAKKHVVQLIIFLLMPLLEIVAALVFNSFTGSTSAVTVYIILAAARIVMWLTAFFLSRKGLGVGGASALVAIIAAVFVFGGAGAVFEFPLGDRPLLFEYNADTVTDEDGNVLYGKGYVITKVLEGMRDNVRIPSTYKGEPVVALDSRYYVSSSRDKTKTLELPANIEYCSFFSDNIKNLTVHGKNVRFSSVIMGGLENVTFTSSEALPQNLPNFGVGILGTTDYNGEKIIEFKEGEEYKLPKTISFDRELIDEAMSSTNQYFRYARERFVPILEQDEHYVMYYTDCALEDQELKDQYCKNGDYYVDSEKYALYNGYIIDGFYEDTQIVKGGTVSLPSPNLQNEYGANYEFLGWYTSRDYTEQVTSLRGNANTKLFAKYRWLYTVELYKDSSDEKPTETFQYHKESADRVLPNEVTDAQWGKQDYAFCGWFDKGNANPQRNQDVKSIPTSSVGDRKYAPVYKRLYTLTVHSQSGTYNNVTNLPLGNDKFQFHEWSDLTKLDANATKTGSEAPVGYTFMGWYRNYNGLTYSEKVTEFPLRREQYRDGTWSDDYLLENVDLYLKFNLNYAITIDTNGGTLSSQAPSYYHVESQTFSIPSASRTGYNFKGWHLGSESGETVVNIPTGSTGEKKFFAEFTPIHYTVQYDANGGTGSAPSNSVFTYDAADNTLRANGISNFTRTGYEFSGWRIVNKNFDAGATVPQGENFTATDGATVTARANWTPITYTVEYSAGEEATGSVSSSTFTYDAENRIASGNGLSKTGYTFDGWYLSGNSGVTYRPGATTHNFTSTKNATITLVASWKANTYYIRYDANGGEGSMTNSTFIYDGVSQSLKANTFTRTGYTFVGWSINGTVYPAGTVAHGINFSSANGATVSALAQWKANTYYVNYVNGGGSGNMAMSEFTYDSADNALKANTFTRTGYTFAGWEIDGNVYQAGTVTQGVNFASTQGATVTATAQWTPITYTVTYAGGADGVTGSMQNSTFTYDSKTNLLRNNNFVRTGYNFVCWVINGNEYDVGTVAQGTNFASTQSATVTATAKWRENTYLVRYNAGGGAGNMSDSTFTYNKTNTLKANTFTREGYTFAGWNIGGTTYQPGTTTVNFTATYGDTITATAVWTPNTYTVRYEGGTGASGSTASSTFTYGQSNTLATCGFTREGYRFAGWSIGGETYQAGATTVNFTSTDGAAVTATAVWEAIS